MGMSDSSRTIKEVALAARFFRVLGDPTRLRLICLLERGERSVGELVGELGLPQARVSTHLACLRHCGFAIGERRGKEVVYRLVPSGLTDLFETTGEVIAPIAERLATTARIGADWSRVPKKIGRLTETAPPRRCRQFRDSLP